MTLTREQKRRLPKAALIHVWLIRPVRWPGDYRTRSPFFIRWRNANAYGFLFGNLMVTIRAPWLEHAARALHPEVFVSEGDAA
ncbi:hypothetical protein [Tsuneonella suprasediminis]|uniref:hypothetical protein n=1 Tax=Tsuneonella suprasediminis TaxID=2306996 RepID=UPI002F95280F